MRKILITGVSRGLGLALSRELSSEGTSIVGFSRSKGDFDGEFHSCDFSKPQVTSGILDNAIEQMELKKYRIIVFVSNAGQLGPLDFIERLDTMEINDNLSANLTGTAIALSKFIACTQDLDIKKLFICVSSGAALPDRVKPGWSLYCAAKAGQEQLIRTVSAEQAHADYPAKIINFNPGVMETGMQQLIRNTPKSSFPDVGQFIKLKEEGKVNEPQKIAQHLSLAIDAYDILESGKTYTYSDFS